MAILDALKTRIETLSISGYVVKTGYMPATPDKVIALYEYGGNPPEFGFSQAGLLYGRPGLNIKVRGAADDYVGPRAIMDAIWQDLPKIQATTLSGYSGLIHMIRPTGSPTVFERDGNKRVVFNVNFILEMVVA